MFSQSKILLQELHTACRTSEKAFSDLLVAGNSQIDPLQPPSVKAWSNFPVVLRNEWKIVLKVAASKCSISRAPFMMCRWVLHTKSKNTFLHNYLQSLLLRIQQFLGLKQKHVNKLCSDWLLYYTQFRKQLDQILELHYEWAWPSPNILFFLMILKILPAVFYGHSSNFPFTDYLERCSRLP